LHTNILPREVCDLRTYQTEMFSKRSTDQLHALSLCRLTHVIPVNRRRPAWLLADSA